jgi:hypothetical protein
MLVAVARSFWRGQWTKVVQRNKSVERWVPSCTVATGRTVEWAAARPDTP